MSKEIDGKIYNDILVGKINVNGEEIKGNEVQAKYVTDGVMLVTIIAEEEDK